MIKYGIFVNQDVGVTICSILSQVKPSLLKSTRGQILEYVGSLRSWRFELLAIWLLITNYLIGRFMSLIRSNVSLVLEIMSHVLCNQCYPVCATLHTKIPINVI